MKVYKITDLKEFTTQLFVGETFDNFLLTEAYIATAYTTTIDGRIAAPAEGDEEFVPWQSVKPVAMQLIRGKQLPRSFRIVFKLSTDNMARTLSAMKLDDQAPTVAGLYINIRYEEQELTFTTGASRTTFTTDREVESGWDQMGARFLAAHHVSFDEL